VQAAQETYSCFFTVERGLAGKLKTGGAKELALTRPGDSVPGTYECDRKEEIHFLQVIYTLGNVTMR
jgi:hypothetical protein